MTELLLEEIEIEDEGLLLCALLFGKFKFRLENELLDVIRKQFTFGLHAALKSFELIQKLVKLTRNDVSLH